jgi:hypothetical protein
MDVTPPEFVVVDAGIIVTLAVEGDPKIAPPEGAASSKLKVAAALKEAD